MPKASPKFQVGDYVRLTPEWADELEHSSSCTTFRPYIGSTFTVTCLASSGEGCYIRPLYGYAEHYTDGFWFGFDKLRPDVFMDSVFKAVRNG